MRKKEHLNNPYPYAYPLDFVYFVFWHDVYAQVELALIRVLRIFGIYAVIRLRSHYIFFTPFQPLPDLTWTPRCLVPRRRFSAGKPGARSVVRRMQNASHNAMRTII